jgi:hypothetical protein
MSTLQPPARLHDGLTLAGRSLGWGACSPPGEFWPEHARSLLGKAMRQTPMTVSRALRFGGEAAY